MLRGELYGELRDQRMFDQVKIEREIHTLVWPNGSDFDPATLREWPESSSDVDTQLVNWEHPAVENR